MKLSLKSQPKLYLSKQSYYDDPTDNFNGFYGHSDGEIFNFNKWYSNFIIDLCCSDYLSSNELFLKYINDIDLFYYINSIIINESSNNFLPKYYTVVNVRNCWYNVLHSYYKWKYIIDNFSKYINKNIDITNEKIIDPINIYNIVNSVNSVNSVLKLDNINISIIDIKTHMTISSKSLNTEYFNNCINILDEKMNIIKQYIITELSDHFEVIFD